MVFVNVFAVELQGVAFMAEHFESERLVQLTGWLLTRRNAQLNLLQTVFLTRAIDQGSKQGSTCSLSSRGRANVDAPDDSFVAALETRAAGESGDADQFIIFGEGSNDEVFAGGMAQTRADGLKRYRVVLRDGFGEGMRFSLKALAAETAELVSVGFGEQADIHVSYSSGFRSRRVCPASER